MTPRTPARTPEAVRRALDRASPLAYVVDPGPGVLEALAETLDSDPVTEPARLLVDADQFKDQTEDFLFSSTLADLVEAGVVTVRTRPSFANSNLFVGAGMVVQLLTLDGHCAGVETDATGVADALDDHYAGRWDDADPVALRTPGRSVITSSLGSEISPDAEADFTAVVASLDSARGGGSGLDEVMIALLVAAKNEALLYDISKWGEDVGLASKATFSRTKSRLEELGLIDTEKVPIDVGRPRLRLKFADERLQSASADELASVAQGLLS